MNWKAVGVETGKIYATGTHADCVRVINERISNNDWHMDGTCCHYECRGAGKLSCVAGCMLLCTLRCVIVI